MSAFTIARVELTRLFRDRSNLFFVLGLPLLLVILIGSQFGEGAQEARIGVVAPDGDEEAAALVDHLDAAGGIATVPVVDEQRLASDVARGRLSAGVVVPPGFGAALAADADADLRFVGRPDATAISLRTIVEAAVADQAKVIVAARVAGDVLDRPPADLVAVAAQLRDVVPRVEVAAEAVGADELAQEFAGLGQFDLGASSQLFLFVFLTSLTSGSALIQTREYGIARRMLATPTGMPTILAGLAGGRLLVALTQAGYIVLATWLLFRVDWGDPLATTSVVVLFALVSAGAGMLLGSVLRNDSQAGGAGVGLGLVLAALGGSMLPLEFFPQGMRAVAKVTPHAWANEAMAEIVRRGGGVVDVLPQLAVLAVYAAALLVLATILLRRTLTR